MFFAAYNFRCAYILNLGGTFVEKLFVGIIWIRLAKGFCGTSCLMVFGKPWHLIYLTPLKRSLLETKHLEIGL